MITFITEMAETQIIDKIFCDRCNKEIIDEMEMQEMYQIKFVGGYTSVFGDMTSVSCDLCQECLKELIGNFCIYKKIEE